MFDPPKYREACTHLTLGTEKLEEMITMTENTNTKKHLSRPIKTVLIAAACVAALCITAFAASPAGQEIFHNLVTSYTIVSATEDGTNVVVPVIQTYTEDDHTFLVVDDTTIDITEELEKNGSYSMETEDHVFISVDSDGVVSVNSEDITYSFNADGSKPDTSKFFITEGENGEVLIDSDAPNSVTVSDYIPAD